MAESSRRRLLSVGFDTAMRVIDVSALPKEVFLGFQGGHESCAAEDAC